MLARRFGSLLPPLGPSEIQETAKVYSIMGRSVESLLQGARPFRSPHHGVSEAGLIGGGSPPQPGEITLAHNGVLFLDEFPEFRRSVIEALRAPIENRVVTISRAKGSVQFPAHFQLIAAMNPCPCGRLGVPGVICECPQQAIQKYVGRISQPILDRIDLHVELDAIPYTELLSEVKREKRQNDELPVLVIEARDRQLARNSRLNSTLEGEDLTKVVQLDERSELLLRRASENFGLSARTFVRVLRVARTIADLASVEKVAAEHVAEALSYRTLERIRRSC